jgi:predicted metal-dependent hydrolase
MSRLTVRRPRLHDFVASVPADWLPEDPFRAQLFNGLSFLFPQGERYFIDAVRAAQPRIADPAVLEDIRRFIAQESIHAGLHGALNGALVRGGLRDWVGPFLAWRIRRTQRFTLINKLAISAAYEHLTAALGDGLLANPHWLDGAAEPMRVLWTWHAAEEGEHRSVVHDVYRRLGGGETRRIAWFLYACFMVGVDLSIQTLINLRRTGHMAQWRTWGSAVRLLVGRRGVGRALVRPMLAYFRPGFRPGFAPSPSPGDRWLSAHGDWFVRPPGQKDAGPLS